MPELERLSVATDGSCLGNPGPGGWAWAASSRCWAAGGHPDTTNNLMELRAVYAALQAFPPEQPLLIKADSQYAINCATKWISGWRQRGWKTADRKPVKNQQAIRNIDALLAGRDVCWEYVKGHAGHPMNEFVDDRARAAATAMKTGLPVDEGPGARAVAPRSVLCSGRDGQLTHFRPVGARHLDVDDVGCFGQ